MAEDIFVVGVGMTAFGRATDRSLKALVAEAVAKAFVDAGADAGSIGAAYFANSTQGHMDGQHMVRGQIALRPLGIEGVPVVNVENACAGGSTAFALAVNHVRAGGCDIALAVGAEKMISPDRSLMMSVFDSGWEVAEAEDNRARLTSLGEGVVVPEGSTSPKPYSVFMDVYAAFARQHMRQFGSTQRQFACVSSKNHGHSVHNPLAQFREPFSVEQVLGAAPITFPLTLPMCSPVSDGAAAVIVASRNGLRRLGLSEAGAVRVLATVIQTGTERDPSAAERHITALAARRAYELASIGPGDVSVAEVHDATAVGEVIQTENLGFCAFGEGGLLAERGETTIGGRIPVNPSGGLESKGHPIAATGLGQLHELVHQLRGSAGARQVEGARIAVAENGGGLFGIEEAVACVTVLGV